MRGVGYELECVPGQECAEVFAAFLIAGFVSFGGVYAEQADALPGLTAGAFGYDGVAVNGSLQSPAGLSCASGEQDYADDDRQAFNGSIPEKAIPCFAPSSRRLWALS